MNKHHTLLLTVFCIFTLHAGDEIELTTLAAQVEPHETRIDMSFVVENNKRLTTALSSCRCGKKHNCRWWFTCSSWRGGEPDTPTHNARTCLQGSCMVATLFGIMYSTATLIKQYS